MPAPSIKKWTGADGDQGRYSLALAYDATNDVWVPGTGGLPSGDASAALTPQVTPIANSSLVLKAAPGNLYGYNIVTGGTAGYLMIFDATSAPADGTVTPKLCIPVAANAGIDRTFDRPLRFAVGITLVFSSTGPFTKTASATAFLAGEAV